MLADKSFIVSNVGGGGGSFRVMEIFAQVRP